MKHNRLILKSQQRFRGEKHNVFTEQVNNIALSPNDDKRIYSIDSVETCVYGTNAEIMHRKEEIKCNNVRKYDEKWLPITII